jgi:hypothetical protein
MKYFNILIVLKGYGYDKCGIRVCFLADVKIFLLCKTQVPPSLLSNRYGGLGPLS